MRKESFEVLGMTCSACSTKVEKTILKQDGVKNASVNLLTSSMEVFFDESLLTTKQIEDKISSIGYETKLKGSTKEEKKDFKEEGEKQLSKIKNRLIISIAFMLPIMYLSMGLMGMFYVPNFIKDVFDNNENGITLAFTQFLLLLPICYVNRNFFINGFKNLFKKAPNMDSLIAIGSTSAIVYGIYAIYKMSYAMGRGDFHTVMQFRMDLYFEAAGMILTLITLGKYFEMRSKGKTTEAIEKLMDLAPKKTVVVRDDKEVEVLVEDLAVGDIIAVYPGALIPVDGSIISGNTTIDESAVTGESVPVEKGVGDKVISATLNTSGYIRFRAEKIGKDTTISQIIKIVEEASSSKAPIAKVADKVAGIFVPIVILIAIATFIVWIFASKDFSLALSMSITTLVISCPCAMGLATPVAIMVGMGRGASSGILIKSGEALEVAHKVSVVVLDKTGTITNGKPIVTDFLVDEDEEIEEVINVLYALEKSSSHPLAKSIVNFTKERITKEYEVKDFDTVHGKGVVASVNGKKYFAGNTKFINENTENVELPTMLEEIAKSSKTPIMLATKSKILAIVGLFDVPKKTSKAAIKSLQEMGIKVVMLTGDNVHTAASICKSLDLEDFVAEVLPQEKEKEILKLKEKGHIVSMVGDGINDAPALMRSDFSIAIGAGTDVAIESADAILIKNDLQDVVTAISLSKATIKNIKENLFWAFFYNILCIPIAAGVLYIPFHIKLSPMIGAAAMGFSSVFVVLNALRLKAFKKKTHEVSYEEIDENEVLIQKFKSVEKRGEIKMYTLEVTILGMTCANCVKHVKNALTELSYIDEVEVSLEDKKATISLTAENKEEEIKEVIEEEGYEVVEIEEV